MFYCRNGGADLCSFQGYKAATQDMYHLTELDPEAYADSNVDLNIEDFDRLITQRILSSCI